MSDYQAVEIVDASSDEDECPEDDDPVLPPSQNEIEGAIETLKKLTLFSNDSELDPLLLTMSKQINQRRLNQMKQSSITDFFEKKLEKKIVNLFLKKYLLILFLPNVVLLCRIPQHL